ncbi:MAG: preprotein translocase subunit SecG [Bacteroidota bacterium]|jgi:preprotein translocase subunit SecG
MLLSVFVVLMIIASVLLILIVLIQNPKGGGLSSTFGGFNNQLLGVQRTTDFLEKSTWALAAIIAVIALGSFFVMPKANKNGTPKDEVTEAISKQKSTGAPMPTAPAK